MRKLYPAIILASCIIASLGSCTKKGNTGPTGPTGPAGPTGPSFKGVINGHVSIYDQYGSKMFTGLNGVQLTLQNGIAVTTDATGYFIFDSVVTGSYSVLATGTGLAGTKM